MSSYAKPSSSFQKHIINQKQQKTQEKIIKTSHEIETTKTINHTTQQQQHPLNNNTSSVNKTKCSSQAVASGQKSNAVATKEIHPITKDENIKGSRIIKTDNSVTSNLQKIATSSVIVTSTAKNVTHLSNPETHKNTNIRDSAVSVNIGKKPHASQNNSKWRRNNFPIFYGGYPPAARIGVASTLPYLVRHYPNDASFYYHAGLYPPHFKCGG